MDAFFKNASRIHFRIKALARKCIRLEQTSMTNDAERYKYIDITQ
jgi:hypothetical protein